MSQSNQINSIVYLRVAFCYEGPKFDISCRLRYAPSKLILFIRMEADPTFMLIVHLNDLL